MCFSRRSVFPSPYVMKSYGLEQVFNFVDFGVTMDCKLNFILHVNGRVFKAKGVLSFFKRCSKKFRVSLWLALC